MKVDWTFITEDKHFANGLEGRKTYWVLIQHEDGRLTVDIDGTDKYGDFPDNDTRKENPTWPMQVIAYAPLERPDVPEYGEIPQQALNQSFALLKPQKQQGGAQ